MKFKVLTLFPNMFNGFLTESIIKRAIDEKLVNISINNIRDYSKDKHQKVDDTPYGGGSGMLLMCQPVMDAVKALKTKKTKVIMLSPDGEKFNQDKAYDLSNEEDIILICGHYEGFDERISSVVDEKISIGDYVLTGGELPSMVVMDSVIRLIPGVIKEDSHLNDSFNDNLLDYPQYTKPSDYKGMKVPDVLLSGDHKKIDEWRKEEAIKKTKKVRPDLLKEKNETKRKQIGNYTLMEDNTAKKIDSINLNDTYNFKPKNNIKKEDLASISKIVLVEPTFIETIAKKNINKKLNVLLKQVSIVLNDETDQEGSSYVLGEIDRLENMILSNYEKYLSSDYIKLIRNKLSMLKDEIKYKQMMIVQTIDYEKEKGRSL
ncbi:MAG: tRNA (guanosine(37)-N1)-methyltransferase TrmD [Bacilli bacterium]|nr:tRNA (guanosine(37)-N1)-methyltransferase TrmD [Bacilli bacterium]